MSAVDTPEVIVHVRENFGALADCVEKEVFRRGLINVSVAVLYERLQESHKDIFTSVTRTLGLEAAEAAIHDILASILYFAHRDNTYAIIGALHDQLPLHEQFYAVLNPQYLEQMVASVAPRDEYGGVRPEGQVCLDFIRGKCMTPNCTRLHGTKHQLPNRIDTGMDAFERPSNAPQGPLPVQPAAPRAYPDARPYLDPAHPSPLPQGILGSRVAMGGAHPTVGPPQSSYAPHPSSQAPGMPQTAHRIPPSQVLSSPYIHAHSQHTHAHTQPHPYGADTAYGGYHSSHYAHAASTMYPPAPHGGYGSQPQVQSHAAPKRPHTHSPYYQVTPARDSQPRVQAPGSIDAEGPLNPNEAVARGSSAGVVEKLLEHHGLRHLFTALRGFSLHQLTALTHPQLDGLLQAARASPSDFQSLWLALHPEAHALPAPTSQRLREFASTNSIKLQSVASNSPPNPPSATPTTAVRPMPDTNSVAALLWLTGTRHIPYDDLVTSISVLGRIVDGGYLQLPAKGKQRARKNEDWVFFKLSSFDERLRTMTELIVGSVGVIIAESFFYNTPQHNDHCVPNPPASYTDTVRHNDKPRHSRTRGPSFEGGDAPSATLHRRPRRETLCKYFRLPCGCRAGDKCLFIHQ